MTVGLMQSGDLLMPRRVRARERGLTYLMLLVLVAVTALVSASLLRQGSVMQRKAAERELLAAGWRLTQALESYGQATPAGGEFFPRQMGDLLRDPRFPGQVVRHLRRVEVDPVTGQPGWGEVRSPDGRHIMGFHSLSGERPMQQLFQPPFTDFNESSRYSDWVFKAGLGE